MFKNLLHKTTGCFFFWKYFNSIHVRVCTECLCQQRLDYSRYPIKWIADDTKIKYDHSLDKWVKIKPGN